MFKNNSFENEIYQSMEKNLVANQVEDTHGFNKIAKAIDYLNNAANIFEKAGMYSEASEVIEILESFAGKDKKYSSKKRSKKEPIQLDLFQKLPAEELLEVDVKPLEMVEIVVEEKPHMSHERPVRVTEDLTDSVGPFAHKNYEEQIKNILETIQSATGTE
jgi:hypothetical protein